MAHCIPTFVHCTIPPPLPPQPPFPLFALEEQHPDPSPMLIGRLYIKETSRSLEMTGADFISSLRELPRLAEAARLLSVLSHVHAA